MAVGVLIYGGHIKITSSKIRGLAKMFIQRQESVVYGITFDLDNEIVQANYGKELHYAYVEIAKLMRSRGFVSMGDKIYFGDPLRVNGVDCVLTAVEIGRKFPWFLQSAIEIKMFRIDEITDLKTAINF